jgi:hypothetical protein
MKKTVIAILCSCLAVTPVAAETLKVTTRENSLRSDCRFFAPVKVNVVLGDQLVVKGRQGDWYLVSAKGVNGCIHKSAVEKRNFAVSGKGAAGGVSADEVSLAGKGFNSQVEAGYRKSGKNLNYTAVDEIMKFSVSEKSLESFVLQGRLNQP